MTSGKRVKKTTLKICFHDGFGYEGMKGGPGYRVFFFFILSFGHIYIYIYNIEAKALKGTPSQK